MTIFTKPWNRCDVCGRFIAIADFEEGVASRKLLTPSTSISCEEWDTLCKEHAIQSSKGE